ncbi:MAG TPA: hypothetical protein VFR48_10475, partial [Solirubrobacteraceae bacterium]|nr:hypothetical protein [Solirubrobacteraceae bacterium]
MLIRPRRAGSAALALAATLAVSVSLATDRGSRASAASEPATLAAQPVIGLPVSEPTLIGSSPGEAAGESWGYAQTPTGFQIVRYIQSGAQPSGWQLQPEPLTAADTPLGAFAPATGPQAARVTHNGGVAILGQDGANVEQLLVRNPNGRFQEAPRPTAAPPEGEPTPPNAVLEPGETLFPSSGEGALIAALDQEGGLTGAFVVPHENGSTPVAAVLHYDGMRWRREPICVAVATGGVCSPPTAGFKVLAIGASSPQNAWLLAQSGTSSDGIVLLARETEAAQARWIRQPLGGTLGALFGRSKDRLASPGTPAKEVEIGVSALRNGQPLTVTGHGIWVDGRLSISAQQAPAGFTLYYDSVRHEVSASWCSVPPEAKEMCTYRLDSSLPAGQYRSFGWDEGGQYGERVITGLNNGVTLSLAGAEFKRVLGIGGESGTTAGAAFSSPQEGWLAPATGNQLTHLTTDEEPDQLQPWPVPFRRPLTAVATQPGAVPGGLGAQAIAVGQDGEVAHFFPGQGWAPEALSLGEPSKADLRGVAWPEPSRAYAVGTKGAMWLWQQATGLWEPDPARPPNLFLANFTAIAFNPVNPAQGYAVGQQGVLLGYGKTWQQENLPPGLGGPEGANFTSIAFAGGEALATYQVPDFQNGNARYSGGVLAYGQDPSCEPRETSCWHIDEAADAAFRRGTVPVRVAGLPDGGAVIVNAEGEVIERQAPGAPWQMAPAGPLSGYPTALAAIREDGVVKAVTSIGGSALKLDLNGDEALRAVPPAGQAPVATAPYPLPESGYLVRERPSGWIDEEHGDYPSPNHSEDLSPANKGFDWPILPDAVLALALAPDGGEGWAIGGQTGGVNAGLTNDEQIVEAIQTAGVMRYPAGGAPPIGFSPSPERTAPGAATFAIGGGAQCATACADLAEDQLGPDRWLRNAVGQAAATAGVRAFLYTGPHLAPGLAQAGPARLDSFAFEREEERYSQLLSGALPVYAAASESDLDMAGDLRAFTSALSATHAPAGSVPAGAPAPPTQTGAYALESAGPSGGKREKAWVVVLDYSQPSLGSLQECWLAQMLAAARNAEAPALVIGNRSVLVGRESGNEASDATIVAHILATGAAPPGCSLGGPAGVASAYFFDSPEQDRVYTISGGSSPLYAYGVGTLGYISPPAQTNTQFLGASGFLLAELQLGAREADNRAPVDVRLVPDISQLAIHSSNGVLLRRSQTAAFEALARRPPAGMECQQAST